MSGLSWPWSRPRATDDARWVVLDVETSGLDPRRCELLAVSAMAVQCDWSRRRLALALSDSVSLALRPDRLCTDKANVLVHGIGTGRQREGLPPPQALSTLIRYAGGAPLLAFHAAFDREVLERQVRRHLGPRRLVAEWLDIAHLCRAAFPEAQARSLDEWLSHFGIACLARHEAAADVLAECELLQRIWPAVARECGSWREVQRFAARHAWLARG